MTETSGSVSSASSKQIGSISFSVDRMISILVNNLHRVEPLWDQVVGHFLELAEHSNQNLRNMALDALDQSICAVLGSEQFGEDPARSRDATLDVRSLFAVLA
jgi:F420-0:gamma-glutamyl ligase-like protein